MALILLFPRDVRRPMTGSFVDRRLTTESGAEMRTVADSTGTVWTVFEVKKTGPADQWTYLPEQFGNGWLCFESDLAKRRLTPVPAEWSDMSDRGLLDLLKKAQAVTRSRASSEESRAE